nr:probable E3 ubiquitin-protein ligase RHY1A [Ipomoea batatas]
MENSSANAQESGTTVINALLIPNFIANLTLLQTDFSLYGLNPGSKNQFPYSSSFTVLFLSIIQNQVIESRRQLHHDAAAALPLLLPVIIRCRPYIPTEQIVELHRRRLLRADAAGNIPIVFSARVAKKEEIGQQRSAIGKANQDEKLGAAAREAKERLDERLKSGPCKSDHKRNGRKEAEKRGMVMGDVQMEVYVLKSKAMKWARKLGWKASEGEEECAICLDHFKDGDFVFTLLMFFNFGFLGLVTLKEKDGLLHNL